MTSVGLRDPLETERRNKTPQQDATTDLWRRTVGRVAPAGWYAERHVQQRSTTWL